MCVLLILTFKSPSLTSVCINLGLYLTTRITDGNQRGTWLQYLVRSVRGMHASLDHNFPQECYKDCENRLDNNLFLLEALMYFFPYKRINVDKPR